MAGHVQKNLADFNLVISVQASVTDVRCACANESSPLAVALAR